MITSLQKSVLYLCIWISLLASFDRASAHQPFEPTQDLPIAYQGRFRSLDSAAKLWLFDFYHKDKLKTADLPAFHTSDTSALELLWKFHFFGQSQFDASPLFWLHYADVKLLLKLDLQRDRFSFNELMHAVNEDPESNLQLMRFLLPYEFARNYFSAANRTRSEKSELSALSPGLWVALQKNALVVVNTPATPLGIS